MRPLKFAHKSDTFFDMHGIKDTVKPDDFQKQVMEDIYRVSGIEVVQDRRAIAEAYHPHEVNQVRGSFIESQPGSMFEKHGIIMNIHATNPYWWTTLFHELAHATGTPEGLHRPGLSRRAPTPAESHYEEAVAETVGSKLAAFYGTADEYCVEHSAEYVQHHIDRFTLYQPNMRWDQVMFDRDVQDALSVVSYWLEQTRVSDLMESKAA